MLFTLVAAAVGAVAGVASVPLIDQASGPRWRWAYAVLLPALTLVYFGFALWGGSGVDRVLAALAVAVFSFIAGMGAGQSPWWLPGGLALHGVWCLLHHFGLAHAGIPGWFPMLSATFDFSVAALLARRVSGARA